MKIIVPVNNKGGVGKTKLSTILCEYFSLVEKQRVLGIDFDPQCNFSKQYLKMEFDPSSPEGVIPPIHEDFDPEDPDNAGWDGRSSIADIFYGEPILPYTSEIPNLDIAPGSADKLLRAELVRKTEVQERVHQRLSVFLNCKEVRESYDVVIVDTAPSKGPLTVAAIKAATHLLIPTVMEEQPIQGVYGMLQLWMQESFRRESEGLKPPEIVGILPNMYKKNTTLHRNMLDSLRANESIGKYIMPYALGDRIVYAEVDSVGNRPTSVFELPEKDVARQEALSVCNYLSEKVFKPASVLEGNYE